MSLELLLSNYLPQTRYSIHAYMKRAARDDLYRLSTSLLCVSQTQDDADLNLAFVEGQDLSLDVSFRRSLCSIDSIQEQLEMEAISPDRKEVSSLFCCYV